MNRILIAAALALILGAPRLANAQSDDAFLDRPCRDLIDAGWSKMPDVASYVMAKPGASRLGYGSECHIGGLVFAQCWLEPRWPVRKAIDALVSRATHGKRLPDTPACGA